MTLRTHNFAYGVTGNEFQHDDKLIRSLISRGYMGQTRIVAFRQSDPYSTIDKRQGYLLAQIGPNPVDGHDLGPAARAGGEHSLHLIGIIDAHGMKRSTLSRPHRHARSLLICFGR